MDKGNKPGAKLNERQKKFCERYVWDWNGTKSYMEAYPDASKSTAGANAHLLLKNTEIQDYIEYLKRNTAEVIGVSAAMIAAEHQKIAFSDATQVRSGWYTLKQFDGLTEAQKACIAEIETEERELKSGRIVTRVKVKAYDKQKSLDALNKMLGYNATEKQEVNHTGQVNFTLPTGKEGTKDSDSIE